MSRLLWILLVVEAALVICALKGALAGNAAVLLLAANSVLLIWCAKSVRSARAARQKPTCCR
jgi:hypothetical protein